MINLTRTFLIMLIGSVSWLAGWNNGFDVGRLYGHKEAMLEGKIQVICKFQPNPSMHVLPNKLMCHSEALVEEYYQTSDHSTKVLTDIIR